MNIEALKEGLRPWIEVDTWHTEHSFDIKRFHKALMNIFHEHGSEIDSHQFKEAMSDLVDEYSPDLEGKHKELKIENYSQRAEYIVNYVSDVTAN